MRAGFVQTNSGFSSDLEELIINVIEESGGDYRMRRFFFQYNGAVYPGIVWVVADEKVYQRQAFDFAKKWVTKEYGAREAERLEEP